MPDYNYRESATAPREGYAGECAKTATREGYMGECARTAAPARVHADLDQLAETVEQIDRAIDRLAGDLGPVRYTPPLPAPPPGNALSPAEPARCGVADRIHTSQGLLEGCLRRLTYITSTLQV